MFESLVRFVRVHLLSHRLASSLVCIGLLLPMSTLSAFSARCLAQEQQSTTQESPPTTHEQTIYIPYGKLREVFEKEGRGVYLPYEKFQELWKAAREREVRPSTTPPVESIIVEALNHAKVEKEVIEVRADLRIEVFKKGWCEIPLRLRECALLSAKIGEENAKVIAKPDGSHAILMHRSDSDPTLVQLRLVYAKAISKTPGKNSVTLEAPQAPVNRWQIEVPDENAQIVVQPMLAASNLDSQPNRPQTGTSIQAFVGAAPQVQIEWTPKAEGAQGLQALSSVQTQHEVWVEENVIRSRIAMMIGITRSELREVAVEIPENQKVINVVDANVRKWEIVEKEGRSLLRIELFEPAKQSQSILIESETAASDSGANEVRIRPFVAQGMTRQTGFVAVRVADGLRAESTQRSNLLQVDLAELPELLKRQSWTFSYRFASVPFEASIVTEKLKPKMAIRQLVDMTLDPSESKLRSTTIHTIEQAGVFQLEFEIPTGLEIQSVRGRELPSVVAASVESFQVIGDNKDRLLVHLSKKAIGPIGLVIDAIRRLNDPNLLTPTGTASDITLQWPRVIDASIDRYDGHAVLHIPDSLRVVVGTLTGAREVPQAEAVASIPIEPMFAAQRKAGVIVAFNEGSIAIPLKAERRKPQITAYQLVQVQVESGVAKFTASLDFDIRYSGVKSLRVDIPTDIATIAHLATPQVRESTLPNPSNLSEGYVAWELSRDSEWFGKNNVLIQWERKLEALEIGKSIVIALPKILPQGTDRAWGQIVLLKSEAIDLQPSEKTVGIRPIDPTYDLAESRSIPNASRAFEFQGDWDLSITATRYELEEVKRTSIERVWVQTVITRSGQRATMATYRVSSGQQRLAIQLPQGASFDTQPLRVNGAPVGLEKGANDEYFIPLLGKKGNEPLLVEIRYTEQGSYQQIDLPTFPEKPAIQKVMLSVYLPKELCLLGSLGPWTTEYDWRTSSSGALEPLPNMDENALRNWVQSSISVSEGPPFQKDGLAYLYAALAPDSPPDGSLRLVASSANIFHGGIILAGIAWGLVLLRTSWSWRMVSVWILLAWATLIGFWAPTLAYQIWNAPLFLALGLTGILWLGGTALQWIAAQRTRSPSASVQATISEPSTSAMTQETPATETTKEDHHD